MAVALKFPRASQRTFLLSWPVGVDLTGATLAAALKYSLTDSDADAVALSTGDDPQLTVTVTDAVAAQATLTFLPSATAAVPVCANPLWQVVTTLSGGEVYVFEAHQGVLDLTPGPTACACGTDVLPPGISATIDDTASIALLPTMLSNVVINRYDLTRLLGGSSVALDGLSAATLAALQNGAILRLFFAGSIVVDYRLRANAGSETESAPWRVICDHATSRLFELVSISKEGVPCSWDPDLSKFRQIQIAAGAITLSDTADAFILPV